MRYEEINLREYVISAIQEFNDIGKEAFLNHYGFGESRDYDLIYEGNPYPPKAIIGVAYKYFSGSPLSSDECKSSSTLRSKYRELGFKIVSKTNSKNSDDENNFRSILHRIMDEYSIAAQQDLAGHPLANFVRNDTPVFLAQSFPQYEDIMWTASVGQGRWSDAPWIASFDPLVTESAQRGYYPVYLFTNSVDAVYISLNQGMTDLKDEFGTKDAKETLEYRAKILRSRLKGQFENYFESTPLDLQHSGPNTRLALYEPGHVFGKRYDFHNLPSNQTLLDDLSKMLELYFTATALGGTSEFDNQSESFNDLDILNTDLEERRKYRYHKRIERNQKLAKLAKDIHGYTCQICGFNFEEVFGELGTGYIEAHHLFPISELPEHGSVKYSPKNDFAVVCANCHRMIHRKDAPKSLKTFKSVFYRTNDLK
jgi:5-methylcytosine-specific restriction enzyme A